MGGKSNLNHGSKDWYIADGWIPSKHETIDSELEGHEALMILNCQNVDAEILLDIFFEDKEPIENVKLKVSKFVIHRLLVKAIIPYGSRKQ